MANQYLYFYVIFGICYAMWSLIKLTLNKDKSSVLMSGLSEIMHNTNCGVVVSSLMAVIAMLIALTFTVLAWPIFAIKGLIK